MVVLTSKATCEILNIGGESMGIPKNVIFYTDNDVDVPRLIAMGADMDRFKIVYGGVKLDKLRKMLDADDEVALVITDAVDLETATGLKDIAKKYNVRVICDGNKPDDATSTVVDSVYIVHQDLGDEGIFTLESTKGEDAGTTYTVMLPITGD
jgi:hypothetical protein